MAYSSVYIPLIAAALIVCAPLHAESRQQRSKADSCVMPEVPVTEDFVQTLDAITQRKINDAESRFQRVSINSPEYPFALLELQKLYYREQAWDRFFGYAVFYRTRLLARHFEPKMLLLEALALIKHCEYAAAEKILDETKLRLQAVPEKAQTEDQLEVAEDLLVLQTQLAQKVKTPPKSADTRAFTNELQWKIDADKASKIITRAVGNPALIRVYVRDACGDKAS